MHVSKLSGARQAALKQLEAAEDALKALGFCVFRQAALYVSPESAHFSTRVSSPYEKDDPMFDHSFADAMRDLAVAWSNAAHGSQLAWVADTGHEEKEHSDLHVSKLSGAGHDRAGYNRAGYDLAGYDRDGYDRDGYNCEGYNRAGYDRDGHDCYDRDGYNRAGYDRDGYDRDGYDRDGYDSAGLDRDGNRLQPL